MKRTTIKEMLKNEGIVIPIIQRDYVQGNDANKEKRDKFIDTIFTKLQCGEKMNLDFIYGRTLIGDGFVPVDGQQRLTTLFLLLWALDSLCKHEDNTITWEKFSYKTKISSRRFIELLVESNYILNIGISKEMQKNTRFDIAWNYDPTVLSMMDMLEELASRFALLKHDIIRTMYKNMLEGCISFDMLDMNEDGFLLNDDLYVKMNARGKQLTEFENFKALLIEFVEQTYPKDKEDVCYKLEYNWTQLFWNSAYTKWESLTEEERRKKPYPIVDDYFLNVMNIITQMLYFKDKSERDTTADAFHGKFEQYKDVYNNTKNYEFLIKALDHLYTISKGNKNEIYKHFTSIFYDGEGLNGPIDKVRIFSDGKSANLFDVAIEQGLDMDTKLKVYFFSYLHYQVYCPAGDIKSFMRLVRNYMEQHRQKKETIYTADIRINRFKTYWEIIMLLANNNPINNVATLDSKSKFIANEKAKAVIPTQYNDTICELEAMRYLKGDLSNHLLPNDNADLPAYAKAVKEIWSIAEMNDAETGIISRAIIACGFGGLFIRNCALGKTYTFGCDDNWDRILLDEGSFSDDNEGSDWLREFLSQYSKRKEKTPEDKLQGIIDDKIKKLKKKSCDWNLCFLRYKAIIDAHTYFARSLEGNYEVEGLGSVSSNPLLAYHVNPYVKYVCENKHPKSRVPWLQYSNPTGQFSSHGVKFQITNNGWKLSGKKIPPRLMKKYYINTVDSFLVPKKGEDMISVVLNFINDLKLCH